MKWLVLGLILWATDAQSACRQALALGLDISGSVDGDEYRLQLDGLADALERPSVRTALLDLPETPVALAIYEWSGPYSQRILQDWLTVDQPAKITDVANRLRDTRRIKAEPSTALGSAMLFGHALLSQRHECWHRVLDISGDGRSNTGPRPRSLRGTAQLDGITINALTIGADDPNIGDAQQLQISELSAYFKAEVIQGRDAFVETALGFQDYADAMERKLLRELEVIVLGRARALQLPVNRYSGSDPSNTAQPAAASH